MHNKASLLVGAQIKDGIFLSTASCRSSSSGYFIPLAGDDISVVAMLSHLEPGHKLQIDVSKPVHASSRFTTRPIEWNEFRCLTRGQNWPS